MTQPTPVRACPAAKTMFLVVVCILTIIIASRRMVKRQLTWDDVVNHITLEILVCTVVEILVVLAP